VWYKKSSFNYYDKVAENIIRKLVEQQVRKRLFLRGDQYVSDREIVPYINRIMKDILNVYGDYKSIRRRDDIIHYSTLIKDIVAKYIPVYETITKTN